MKSVFPLILSVVAQGGKSMSIHTKGYKRCSYRGENGMRCAVGWAIPDSEYNQTFEGNTACSLVVEKFSQELKSYDTTALTVLQQCHDSQEDGPDFVDDFLSEVLHGSGTATLRLTLVQRDMLRGILNAADHLSYQKGEQQ